MKPARFLKNLRDARLGLGEAQILLDLAANPGTTQPLGEIARRIGISPAAITEVRDKLVAKRLIFTPVYGFDRRQRRVALTDKGEQILSELFPQPAKQ